MDCERAAELIGALADGELDAANAAEVSRHLDQCAACSARLAEHRRLAEAVRSGAPYHRAPASLRQAVERAAGPLEGAGRRTGAPPGRRWAISRASWMAAAAALAIVSATVAWEVASSRSAREAIVRDVVAAHSRSLLLTADRLVDVASSDRHTVKPWFAGKVDFSPPAPDLAPDGFTLLGGRVDDVGERTVAALVYQRRAHRISVFIWPAASGTPVSEPAAQTRRGYNLVRWRSAGMEFCAVSDLNADELMTLARLIVKEDRPTPGIAPPTGRQ